MDQALEREISDAFKPIIERQIVANNISEITFNLYGFAKALIKAKMELDEHDKRIQM